MRLNTSKYVEFVDALGIKNVLGVIKFTTVQESTKWQIGNSSIKGNANLEISRINTEKMKSVMTCF